MPISITAFAFLAVMSCLQVNQLVLASSVMAASVAWAMAASVA